ncbi:hypothetical protein PLANTIT3_70096 [Plantibacter sp. T3]|nr:hypothetical protein PLANTIT3_70096 [Plantibacter sp. T3]
MSAPFDRLRDRGSRELAEASECCLAAESEALDQRAVALDVDGLEVAEEAATLSDQEQQATTRVVVVLVLLEVLGEVLDAAGHDRHLDLGGSGVTWVGCVLFDDRLLTVSFKRHSGDPLSVRCAVPVA